MATALTRLALTKELGRWSGQVTPEEITSSENQTGHIGNLVAFIDQAWIDIQLSQHTRWLWMRRRSINTVALTPSTRTLDMSDIDEDARTIIPFYARDTWPTRYVLLKHPSTHSIHMVEYLPYTHWRGYYDKGDRPVQKPVRFTIRPDGTAEFDPTPDLAYTIDCDWITVPLSMAEDEDTPNMPNHFHMLVVWYAMVHLMDFDHDGGRYQTAEREYKKMANRLAIEQLSEDLHDEYLTTGEIYTG